MQRTDWSRRGAGWIGGWIGNLGYEYVSLMVEMWPMMSGCTGGVYKAFGATLTIDEINVDPWNKKT